ncbi:MAG TPA: hypothetical protein VH684_31450 [Xanthobacteraceae bacterium]|jgi:hypothetical protein
MYQMLSDEWLNGFQARLATGKLPRPEGAFDDRRALDRARRYGRDDYDPRDVDQPDSFRTRKAAAEHTTPEESGLDDDMDLRQQMADGTKKLTSQQAELLFKLIKEGGVGSEEALEHVKECILTMTAKGETEDEGQESVTGSMTEGDPDPGLRASAGDRRRRAMDSLANLYHAGRLSTADYTTYVNHRARYGTRPATTSASAASFASAFPDAAKIRSA